MRHGETVDNVNRIMQGQKDGCLTPRGVEQARELGRQLRGEHIDVFVSSDLARAVETLQIIMDELSSRPVSVDDEARHLERRQPFRTEPLLRERDWGSFTGRYIPDLQDEVWPDDIETLDQLKDRARRFLDQMCNSYRGLTVLAVGHGIINKAIQAVYFGKQMSEIQKMMNAECRELIL